MHPYLCALTLATCLTCIPGGGPAMAQTVTVHAAQNSDPDPGPPGAMPYEMVGRAQERAPLVSFDDVSGWEVVGSNAEGHLYLSADQRLWQPYSGKFVYAAKGASPELLVRAKEPIRIPDPWDSLNCWTYGNNWGWAPDPTTPVLQVSAVIRDSAGWEFEMPLGGTDYEYWFLMNARLHAAELARLQRPAYFVGLRFRNAGNADPRKVYLGPCTFYKEELKPLHLAPAPERLRPVLVRGAAGNLLYFERTPAKLPFPTRPETILPTNRAAGFRNTVRQEGRATVFSYLGPDCRLRYRYTPTDGTLGDIELINQGRSTRPCAGGGVQLAGPAGGIAASDPSVKRTLLRQSLEGDTLQVVWRLEAGDLVADVTYRLRIAQKSLIVETVVSAPVADALTLGRVEGIRDAKMVMVPYLTFGGGANDPRVLLADGLFYFSQFDWYVSDASELYGGASLGPDWAICNGGARYVPKTDGARNPVRERLFITASPDFSEVLPTIPNPPSPWKDMQGERLWRTKHGDDHAAEIAEATHLRALGCDKVSVRYHEETWRDTGESYTFRLNAAPGRGGDAALRGMVETVQKLGWRVGLYTNYTDYAPVNAYWNEDWVTRLPNGDWQRAWMRCYAPKPLRAVEMEALLAPQIQAKFGENHSYCDVHTAVTPFSRVDYDARVPGAGTFRQVFECFGRLLYNEKIAHRGSAYSEGNNHWWYAGLVDGNYAQTQVASDSAERLLVDFDLLKMHPLSMDSGMTYRGGPGMGFDQYMACIIAYGHIGNFGGPRDYYLLQQTQKRYAMDPVTRIEYDDNGTLVGTSRAIATDAYKAGRVHVVYANGTEVYVNGSPQPWAPATPAGDLLLPEWGYLVFRPGQNPATHGLDLLTASATVPVGGPDVTYGPRQRVDQCLGTEQFYADSRGGFVCLGALALEGSAAIKRDRGAWWLIPLSPCADVAFSPDLLGKGPRGSVTATALNEDGSAGEAPALRWSRGLLHVLPGARQAFRYRLAASSARRPAALTCDTTLAPVGATIRIGLPRGVTGEGAFWEVAGTRVPAVGEGQGGAHAFRVPAETAPGSHLWLGIPAGSDTLWLDFVAASPLTASLDLEAPARLKSGQRLQCRARISSALETDTEVAVTPSAAGGACEPSSARVRVPARGHAELAFEVALPVAPGRHEIALRAVSGDCAVAASAPVTTEVAYPVLVDLLSPERPYTRGRCVRGGQEIEGFSVVEDGTFEPTTAVSGGVPQQCLFSHPPYRAGQVGYSFAAWDLALPPDRSSLLQFQMGMRDGLHATDGVTFRVVVTGAAGKVTELLSRHYRDLRWEPITVDLSAFAGQRVRLQLIADCGPADDTTADHALWAAPRVVVQDDREMELVVRRASQ